MSPTLSSSAGQMGTENRISATGTTAYKFLVA